MARPLYHVLTTLPIAWWAGLRWGSPAILVALIGGVGIDIDHLVDYALMRRNQQAKYLVVPLHGWEYPVALIILLKLGLIRRWTRHLQAGWLCHGGRSLRPRLDGPRYKSQECLVPLKTKPTLSMLLIVLTMAWTLHLIMDSAMNGPRQPKFYSIIYRLYWSFNVRRIGWNNNFDLHSWARRDDTPWWRYIY